MNSLLDGLKDRALFHHEESPGKGAMLRAIQFHREGHVLRKHISIIVCREDGQLIDFILDPNEAAALRDALRAAL